MAESNSKDDKAITSSKELSLIIKSSELARRGVELISQLQPRILYVPSEYKKIEDAVAQASDGDVIEVASGEYHVNVIIDKSITIRGENQDVKFFPHQSRKYRYGIMEYPKDDSSIIKIDNPDSEVKLQNIIFSTYDSIYYPAAIIIKNGRVLVDNCTFGSFFMSFETFCKVDLNYPNAEVSSMFVRPTILLFGNVTEFIISNSIFIECSNCIFAEKISKLVVEECIFNLEHEDTYGITIRDTDASIIDSIFLSGVPLYLFGNSNVYSKNDYYSKNKDVLFINGNGSVSFNHVTVDADYLLSHSKTSFVTVDALDNLNMKKPCVSISNSIVILKSSFLRGRTINFNHLKNVSIFNCSLVIIEENNLIFSPPDFTDGNPMLGDVEDNKITLLPSSPAIGAASDGLNLGAWQDS